MDNRKLFDDLVVTKGEGFSVGGTITHLAKLGSAFYQKIVETASEGIWVLDPNGNTLYANRQIAQILGCSGVEPSISSIWDYLDAKSTDSIDRNRRILRDGISERFESAFRKMDGSEVWAGVATNSLHDSEGLYVGTLYMITDLTERKESEAERQKFLERLTIAKAAAKLGVHDYDMVNNLISVDERIREIWGVDESFQFTYESFQSSLHPEDVASSKAIVESALNSDTGVYQTEYRVINLKNNATYWIADTGAFFYEDGRPIRLVGIVEDITGRKMLELELQRINAKLQTLMDTVPVGISFSDDVTCDRIYGNPALQNQFQVDEKANFSKTTKDIKAYGRRIRFFQNGREVEDSNLPLQKAIAENKRFGPDEYRLFLPDGTSWFAEITAAPLNDKDGEVTGAIAVSVDITERKKLFEELSSKHRLLDTLLKEAPIGFTYLDRDLRYILINETLASLNGMSVADHVGNSVRDVVPAIADEADRITQEILNTKRPVVNREICGYTKASTELRYWNESWYPIFDEFREIIGFGVVVEEITDRKHAEEQLKRAHEELELRVKERTQELEIRNRELLRSNEDLEHFAYVASHDLQEPLRTITGALQILESRHRGHLDRNSDELIDLAVDGSRRMKSLILDLLVYSRLSNPCPPFEIVNLCDIVDQCSKNMESIITERGALVTYDSMPSVLGNATQLLQVFQNLIQNAVKFCPTRSPRVHVTAKRATDEWVFSVRDNGIGIKPEYFEKIFVIFQQLEKKDSLHGTGIGLAIVKKVVDLHGGRIWVESEPELGSTFYFTIPDRR